MDAEASPSPQSASFPGPTQAVKRRQAFAFLAVSLFSSVAFVAASDIRWGCLVHAERWMWYSLHR